MKFGYGVEKIGRTSTLINLKHCQAPGVMKTVLTGQLKRVRVRLEKKKRRKKIP